MHTTIEAIVKGTTSHGAPITTVRRYDLDSTLADSVIDLGDGRSKVTFLGAFDRELHRRPRLAVIVRTDSIRVVPA